MTLFLNWLGSRIFFLTDFFDFFLIFFKIVLNSDGRVADCRESLIKYIKEGRSESMHPSNNEATIVIVIIIKIINRDCYTVVSLTETASQCFTINRPTDQKRMTGLYIYIKPNLYIYIYYD